ncbi:MAG: AbrB/MazE/SpoVT family DNA-binding domain-containing protein [Acidobacteria bacterium]|nr:AbrB/MazE/SpoVT family DNA-binding domain-containing protein [Acidobacteriota bacterium]
MKTQIVKIGNSKGLRIPKALLEECSLSGDVELEIRSEGLLIKPAKTPRLNWENAFKTMSDNDEDELLVENNEAATTFEKEKWRW